MNRAECVELCPHTYLENVQPIYTPINERSTQPTNQPLLFVQHLFVFLSIIICITIRQLSPCQEITGPRRRNIKPWDVLGPVCGDRIIRAYLQESDPHGKHKLARGRERKRRGREVNHLTTLQLLRLFCKASMVDESMKHQWNYTEGEDRSTRCRAKLFALHPLQPDVESSLGLHSERSDFLLQNRA